MYNVIHTMSSLTIQQGQQANKLTKSSPLLRLELNLICHKLWQTVTGQEWLLLSNNTPTIHRLVHGTGTTQLCSYSLSLYHTRVTCIPITMVMKWHSNTAAKQTHLPSEAPPTRTRGRGCASPTSTNINNWQLALRSAPLAIASGHS